MVSRLPPQEIEYSTGRIGIKAKEGMAIQSKIKSKIKSGLEKKGRRAGCREMVQGEGGNGLMDEKIKDDGVAGGMTCGRWKTDLRHPHPISDHRPISATSPRNLHHFHSQAAFDFAFEFDRMDAS